MPGFRYRMQSILDLKIKTENQARMEFGAARRRLNEEEEALELLRGRRLQYEDEGRAMRGEDSLPVREILDNNIYIRLMDGQIEAQKLEVEKAAKEVEKAREKLTVNIQERKMQEKLRERAFEQYLAEEKDAEGKESDERSSFIYGQKAR